jgi:glycerophosphoryl diester phosphodiesterase
MKGNYAIECDVHLTKDNQVVVFHDSDLQRLTGRTGFAHEYSLADLCTMQIGGTGDCIPSLKQMLDLVDGKVPLVIELKGDAGHDDGLVHHLIREFKKLIPTVPAGLTAEGLRDVDMEAHFSMLAYGIDFVSYNVHHLNNRFVKFVRERLSMPVITWTVRTKQDLAVTLEYAEQATFELMVPDAG